VGAIPEARSPRRGCPIQREGHRLHGSGYQNALSHFIRPTRYFWSFATHQKDLTAEGLLREGEIFTHSMEQGHLP